MSFIPFPVPPHHADIEMVAHVLDPVLEPLGFAAGQEGSSGAHAQVVFCRGGTDGADGGCVDLVVDLVAAREWRITDVRYWGFPSERWHLAVERDADLRTQLTDLARSLPNQLRRSVDG